MAGNGVSGAGLPGPEPVPGPEASWSGAGRADAGRWPEAAPVARCGTGGPGPRLARRMSGRVAALLGLILLAAAVAGLVAGPAARAGQGGTTDEITVEAAKPAARKGSAGTSATGKTKARKSKARKSETRKAKAGKPAAATTAPGKGKAGAAGTRKAAAGKAGSGKAPARQDAAANATARNAEAEAQNATAALLEGADGPLVVTAPLPPDTEIQLPAPDPFWNPQHMPADGLLAWPARRTLPQVSFSHARHMADRLCSCASCHHDRSQTSCSATTACHAVIAVSDRADTLYFAYHAQGTTHSCLGCHERLARNYLPAGPRDCKGCHRD